MTDWPGEATWLAGEHKEWIEQKLEQEKQISVRAITIGQALKSRAILLLAAVNFLNYFVFYSFSFLFPTMLKRQSGFSGLRGCLLCAIPYLATFARMQVNGWHSDRHRER